MTARGIVGFSVVLLAACQSQPSKPVGDSVATRERIESLESRQRHLERQLEQLRTRIDNPLVSSALRGDAESRKSLPSDPISVSGLPALGLQSATIAVIEYSDYQCPYCRRYCTQTWPLLESEYVQTGRVRYFFWDLPLTNSHAMAVGAAEAGECAHRQGRFWQMHDLLFSNPRNLDRQTFGRHAITLGLNTERFNQCLVSEATSTIRMRRLQGAALGIKSTPTFLIGRIEPDGHVRVLRRIAGAQPFPVFRGILRQIDH